METNPFPVPASAHFPEPGRQVLPCRAPSFPARLTRFCVLTGHGSRVQGCRSTQISTCREWGTINNTEK